MQSTYPQQASASIGGAVKFLGAILVLAAIAVAIVAAAALARPAAVTPQEGMGVSAPALVQHRADERAERFAPSGTGVSAPALIQHRADERSERFAPSGTGVSAPELVSHRAGERLSGTEPARDAQIARWTTYAELNAAASRGDGAGSNEELPSRTGSGQR